MSAAENIPIPRGRKTISIPPHRTALTYHIPLFSKPRATGSLEAPATEDTDYASVITILNSTVGTIRRPIEELPDEIGS